MAIPLIGLAGKAMPYLLSLAPAAVSLAQGKPGQAASQAVAAGGTAMLPGVRGLNPIARGAIAGGGGLLGGGAVQAIGGGVGNVAQNVEQLRRDVNVERGGGPITGERLDRFGDAHSMQMLRNVNEESLRGQVAYQNAMFPINQRYAQERQKMQLQLRAVDAANNAALDRQAQTASMARTLAAEAGGTNRTLIQSMNPYAGAVYQGRGG